MIRANQVFAQFFGIIILQKCQPTEPIIIA